LRGERDASARATHLEAATRKFLVTTNERKQMSTKTNFKRIALVAVAALGLGVISAVPSSAAISSVVIDVTNGATPLRGTSTTTVNSDTGTGTGATISISYLTTNASDSVTVAFYNKNALATASTAYLALVDTSTSNLSRVLDNGLTSSNAAMKVSGGATFDSSLAGVTTFGMKASTNANGTSPTTGSIGATFALFLDTRSSVTSAGTYTYTVVVTTYSATPGTSPLPAVETSKDVSIVVAAPSLTPSSGATTFYMGNGAALSAEAEVTPKLATASTTAAAYFTLDVNTAAGLDALETVTATVSGPGLIYNATTAAYGKSMVLAQTGSLDWTLVPDGGTGVSTVTFALTKAGTSFTRTVSFYSAKAGTIAASTFSPILKVGTNDYAVAVTAKDASSNSWTGATYIYASSAADALIAGSETPGTCGSYNPATGLILCSITGKLAGTAKFKVIDAATVATANATSNEVTVTVSNESAATVKIAFNKATYVPGEKALITVTPVSSTGKNLAAGTYTNLLDAGGITSSVQLGTGSAALDSVTAITSAYSSASSNLVAGSMTYVVYMPVVGGTVKITADGGTGLPIGGQVEVSATATVTDNAAAALAAVTALATTVASLKTLITTLTNLVLKIQKKVKA